MSSSRWKEEHARQLNIWFNNDTGIPQAIAKWLNDHDAEHKSDFLRPAIEEKLSAEGYIPSDNTMYKLRKSAEEYGCTIIEWVADVLENRRAEEAQFPELGHMNARDAVMEAYELTHPKF